MNSPIMSSTNLCLSRPKLAKESQIGFGEAGDAKIVSYFQIRGKTCPESKYLSDWSPWPEFHVQSGSKTTLHF